MKISITPNKYYKTGEISSLHPVLESRGYSWILRQIKDKRLPAVNTSDEENPRFIVQGQDIINLINSLIGGTCGKEKNVLDADSR